MTFDRWVFHCSCKLDERYVLLRASGYEYKIQDILFRNHGPHKGIISTNIQRKNHNYIEYSYTMTYLSQHIKSNNNNHVVYVARLLSLIQIIFDKFAYWQWHCKYWDIFIIHLKKNCSHPPLKYFSFQFQNDCIKVKNAFHLLSHRYYIFCRNVHF